jgi:hypothetical protein
VSGRIHPTADPEREISEVEAAFLAGWVAAKGIAGEEIAREELADAALRFRTTTLSG